MEKIIRHSNPSWKTSNEMKSYYRKFLTHLNYMSIRVCMEIVKITGQGQIHI